MVFNKFRIIVNTSTAGNEDRQQGDSPAKRVLKRYQQTRFTRTSWIDKVFRTNHREASYETPRFGDDHVLCATNRDPADLICDYIWRFF